MARSRRPGRFCQRNGLRHSHAALSRAAARGHDAAARAHGAGQRLRRGMGSRRQAIRAFDATLSAPGVDAPDGVTRLESFTPEPWPQWTFAVAGRRKDHSRTFCSRRKAPPSSCAGVGGDEATPWQLHVRPFFSGRDFHALHHENPAFQFVPESVPEGERWHFYDGVPAVTARSNGAYHHEPLLVPEFSL